MKKSVKFTIIPGHSFVTVFHITAVCYVLIYAVISRCIVLFSLDISILNDYIWIECTLYEYKNKHHFSSFPARENQGTYLDNLLFPVIFNDHATAFQVPFVTRAETIKFQYHGKSHHISQSSCVVQTLVCNNQHFENSLKRTIHNIQTLVALNITSPHIHFYMIVCQGKRPAFAHRLIFEVLFFSASKLHTKLEFYIHVLG